MFGCAFSPPQSHIQPESYNLKLLRPESSTPDPNTRIMKFLGSIHREEESHSVFLPLYSFNGAPGNPYFHVHTKIKKDGWKKRSLGCTAQLIRHLQIDQTKKAFVTHSSTFLVFVCLCVCYPVNFAIQEKNAPWLCSTTHWVIWTGSFSVFATQDPTCGVGLSPHPHPQGHNIDLGFWNNL